MLHAKQHISDLVEICYRKGIEDIVISPGSRNAPLISAFVKRFGNNCISIVDERSAGYFALGLARTKETPVVLISTSGTAVLNYGPSLAEAYYQHVPLLVITADRPKEWIDQQDNQTIRQYGVYRNYIKKSYQLPLAPDSEIQLTDLHITIKSAIQDTILDPYGPVHLNVPLDEPLYDRLPGPSASLNDLLLKTSTEKDYSLPHDFIVQWSKAKRIMIIHGHSIPDERISEALRSLSRDPRVVIVAENISNCAAVNTVSCPELALARYHDRLTVAPDLLIYSAGQIVTKRLKTYLRGLPIKNTWRIGIDEFPMDTFKQNNQFLKISPGPVYADLKKFIVSGPNNDFKKSWYQASVDSLTGMEISLSELSFCDLKAYDIIFSSIPSNIIIELGNSSVIRYSQLFKSQSEIVYFSNRGVSGIDGCLSTAVGTAYATDKIILSVIGDLSFVYDSNALWNSELPKNLRIIVMNNSGGDIFNMIEGTANQPGIKKFLIANHTVSIQKLAEAFNLGYFCCQNEGELRNHLEGFFNPGLKPSLLEVKTSPKKNLMYFRQVMNRNHLRRQLNKN